MASLFVAIEGGDGSGKGTQAAKLEERARTAGWDVLKISFPQYGSPSAEIIEKYLNGTYGAANDVHPDLGSLPYAIDRFAALRTIRDHLAKPNALVIADRYVASNMAHQGTKWQNEQERRAFYERIKTIEYGVLGIKQPDLNIVLIVPSAVAHSNVSKKEARLYTSATHDIHEADRDHLEKAKANYQELCQLYPKEFVAIDCMENDSAMRSIEDIHEDIWAELDRL